jgi:hypothetical protein
MKKWLFVLLFLVVSIVIYLFISDLLFSPLKEKEFSKLFLSVGTIKKKCSIDYIKLSVHGELFEIYLYNTKNVVLGENFPNYANEWGDKKITDETIISKWKNCPLDTTSYELFKFALTSKDYGKEKKLDTFNEELVSPNNLYSYVYFNDLEQFLLLYCPLKEKLYYIRVSL